MENGRRHQLWTDGDTPPEWQGSKWDELGPIKQAGILCADGAFWKFLSKTLDDCYVDHEDTAARLFVAPYRELVRIVFQPEAARKWP